MTEQEIYDVVRNLRRIHVAGEKVFRAARREYAIPCRQLREILARVISEEPDFNCPVCGTNGWFPVVRYSRVNYYRCKECTNRALTKPHPASSRNFKKVSEKFPDKNPGAGYEQVMAHFKAGREKHYGYRVTPLAIHAEFPDFPAALAGRLVRELGGDKRHV